MGTLYKPGEQKIRPGVYRRYENAGEKEVPKAMVGVFAIPVKADFGPLGEVKSFAFDEIEDMKEMYGTSGTMDAAQALFDGGATKVYIYRLGSGGSIASVNVSSSENGVLATLFTKYPTEGKYNVTAKASLKDPNVRELLIYDNTTLLETIQFDVSTNEKDALVTAVNSKSKYLTAKAGDGAGQVANMANVALAGGSAPTTTTESYSEAFLAFEAFSFNMLVLDTCDTMVHSLAEAYIERIYQEGALSMVALGEPITVPFDERLAHAKAFDNEKVIYLGSGYKDTNGDILDGYLAIAKQAGIIGSLESNKSCVHTVVPGAVDLLEELKNSQYEKAIKNGMVLLARNSKGELWFDSGVNTLVNPNEEQDNGWKKIKRTAIRFEMFDRINRAIEPIVGKVNCDDIGVGDVVLAGQAVLDAMASDNENKLFSNPTFAEDTDHKRGADYAHFVIDAIDKDTLEKIYLRYRFRFSVE